MGSNVELTVTENLSENVCLKMRMRKCRILSKNRTFSGGRFRFLVEFCWHKSGILLPTKFGDFSLNDLRNQKNGVSSHWDVPYEIEWRLLKELNCVAGAVERDLEVNANLVPSPPPFIYRTKKYTSAHVARSCHPSTPAVTKEGENNLKTLTPKL